MEQAKRLKELEQENSRLKWLLADAELDRRDTVPAPPFSTAVSIAGLNGVSHHALRRTAMELSDQGEEIKATDESAKNPGTTTKNKDGFYVRKSHGRTFYLRADRLYAGLSLALLQFPAVAELMMVEDRFKPKTVESVEEIAKRLVDEEENLSPEESLAVARERAARRRRRKGG